jgi:choline-sulfatase
VIASILLAASAAVPAPAPSPTPPPAAGRASVLLLTLDTTRADHLGCYGALRASTPRLDALAKSGVRFEQALSPVPLTLPAHASLLSGRVPRRHGVRDNAGFRLDKSVPLLSERLAAAGYATAAFVSAAVLDREGGLDHGFRIYDDTVRIGDRRAFDYQERAASQTVDAVLARLPQLSPPFFLWVHLYDPHLPYVPPEPYATKFKDNPYDGEIAFMDSQLGRVLDAVKRKAPKLIVVAAGDHGESLGEHGENAHGVFLYQATQHVPLIISGASLPPGATVTTYAGLIDVAPTVLDLLGLPALPDADGRSLVPAMRGARIAPRDYEMETFYPSYSYGWAPLSALVAGPFKYVQAPRPELYELPTDPRETKNIVRAKADRTKALAAALADRTKGDATPQPAEDEEMNERRDRLASLGYTSGSVTPEGGGIDAKDGVKLLPDLDAARHAIQLGDPRDAIAPLTRILSTNSTNVPARLLLGQAHLAVGHEAEAVAAYKTVTELAPNNALAWFDLGNATAARALKDDAAFEATKKAYERSLALSPRHADTYLNFASLQAGRRDPIGARETLLRARAAGVEDPTIETELGLLEAARNNNTAAVAALDRALALNPKQVEALEARGQIAYAAGLFTTAEGYYERALAVNPQARIAKTLGAIRFYELKDKKGAREAFIKARALSPSGDPEIPELDALIEELGRP